MCSYYIIVFGFWAKIFVTSRQISISMIQLKGKN